MAESALAREFEAAPVFFHDGDNGAVEVFLGDFAFQLSDEGGPAGVDLQLFHKCRI